MRKAGGKHTREKIKARKTRQARRQAHIQAIENGAFIEDLPETIFPEIFKDIQETYRKVLKQVPDPRDKTKNVYPLHLILHRIIAGFLSGRDSVTCGSFKHHLELFILPSF